MFQCLDLDIARDRVLLEGVGLTLFPKTVLVVKGENAVGKSTFLHTIAGFYSIKKGNVKLYNIEAKKNKLEYLNKVAFIFDKPVLHYSLTVIDHLMFLAKISGRGMILDAVIRTYLLEDILDREISSLSEGEKKRLYLSKLLFFDKKIWILDEPYVNLDREVTEIFNNVILSYVSSGGTVILTTHYDKIYNSNLRDIQTLNLNDFAV